MSDSTEGYVPPLNSRLSGDDAHDALRLSFHDAIGFSRDGSKGDGADGSLIKYSYTELRYGAKRARAFHSADTILKRVGDAGLTPNDLVELLASHSIGVRLESSLLYRNLRVDRHRHIDFDTTDGLRSTSECKNGLTQFVAPSISISPNTYAQPSNLRGFIRLCSPLASTPKVAAPRKGIDPLKGEVMSPDAQEFRLQSDYTLARANAGIPAPLSTGASQPFMANRFAAAMDKMALLGQNAKILYDCSEVNPAVISSNQT
ncbi:heme peroxidase [Mycena olivaceomarginata]|nr:heme peroxidase [Mycena olivaceomarginata]